MTEEHYNRLKKKLAKLNVDLLGIEEEQELVGINLTPQLRTKIIIKRRRPTKEEMEVPNFGDTKKDFKKLFNYVLWHLIEHYTSKSRF